MQHVNNSQRERPRVSPIVQNGSNDLANLLLTAKRKNAERHRSKPPAPESTQQPVVPVKPPSPPAISILPSPNAFKERSLPASLPQKPVNPVQRTIHAAIPASQRQTSPVLSERKTPKSSRVYSADRRRYDAEFDRSLASDKLQQSDNLQHSDSAASRDTPKKLFDSPKSVSREVAATHGPPAASTVESEDKIFQRQSFDSVHKSNDRDQPSKTLFDPRQHDPVNFKKATKAIVKPLAGDQTPTAIAPTSNKTSHSDAGSSRGGRRRTRPDASGSETSDPRTAVTTSSSAVDRLKRAYKRIVDLEEKRMAEADRQTAGAQRRQNDASGSRFIYGSATDELKDEDYWVDQIARHKELAEAHYTFLQMALDHRLPPSHHSMPQKYNTPARLWQHAFHLLFERLRKAISSGSSTFPSETDIMVSPENLLDYLVEFFHYGYIFYATLLEEPSMIMFRSTWLEQLGDLARYRMAVADLADKLSVTAEPGHELSRGKVAFLPTADTALKKTKDESVDVASIGEAALGDWDVEEKLVWKQTAIDWYGKGLSETPGNGRLHYHLASLSKGDDLRTLYHLCRSLTCSQPHLAAREAMLALCGSEDRLHRTAPGATPSQLFLRLQSMLITKTDLDDFGDVLARFLEALEIDYHILAGFDKSQGDMLHAEVLPSPRWVMMAVVCLSAMLEFGQEDASLKAALGADKSPDAVAKVMNNVPQAIMLNANNLPQRSRALSDSGDSCRETESNPEDELVPSVKQLDVSDAPPVVVKAECQPTLCSLLAQKLCFGLLQFGLRFIFKPGSADPAISPFVTIILTFLTFACQQKDTLRLLEAQIPWQSLIDSFNRIPKAVDLRIDPPMKLTSQPLPEDWCIRGMEWTGRNLFGRGYWKYKPQNKNSAATSSFALGIDGEIGLLESEMEETLFLERQREVLVETEEMASSEHNLATSRWRRLANSAAALCKLVPGLVMDLSIRSNSHFKILPSLANKIKAWRNREQELNSATHQSLVGIEGQTSADSDAEDELIVEPIRDAEQLQRIQTIRKDMQKIIQQAKEKTVSRRYAAVAASSSRAIPPVWNKTRKLHVLPGYTILIFDTNVLLHTLPLFCALLESGRWIMCVPLHVLTELDALSESIGQLGESAKRALNYVANQPTDPSKLLKIQTPCGNYLSDISVRKQQLDYKGSRTNTSEEAVLETAMWQLRHFIDHLPSLNPSMLKTNTTNLSKVAIVSLNRVLRHKARARQLEAINEREIVQCILPQLLPNG